MSGLRRLCRKSEAERGARASSGGRATLRTDRAVRIPSRMRLRGSESRTTNLLIPTHFLIPRHFLI
jgi:hypothetical protein